MNQTVIITGASSGLGLSLAERFCKRGDTVYGVSLSQRNWKEAKRRIGTNARFFLSQIDAASETQIKSFVSKIVKAEKAVDILINNAGYANRPARVEEESLRELQKNISANLISTFLMCKYTLPILKKQKKGWIINIASYAGKRAVPLLGAYSASKFGVVALTQSIAKENLDTAGFKCVAICPGGINTKMREKLFGKEDAERQQSASFVTNKILEIIEGRIAVPSGGDVVIRHGQVTAVNPPAEA